MEKHILTEIFEKHIKGTPERALVTERKVFLCHFTRAVSQAVFSGTTSVYVTTRVLKHLYDKKPAEEFHFLLNHLHKILAYPDFVYENKTGKRGHFCLVKNIKKEAYMCSVETGEESTVVTAFRVRDKSYLKSYKLLWSWEDGAPPS